MKLLIIFLLTSCLFAYDAQLAKKLVYASAAAYASDSEITNWTCQYCKLYPITKVVL